MEFTLNHKIVHYTKDPSRRLLDVLRQDYGLLEIKEGCGEGECGACAVLINGQLVNSCICAVGSIAGKEIITLEAYRSSEAYQVIEKAFAKAGAVQCGYCTPGMVMAAEALLRGNPNPNEEEIRDGISGNLCRCTGYNMIVEGILLAAKEGKGLW